MSSLEDFDRGGDQSATGERSFDPRTYLRILWRRYLFFVVPAGVVVVAVLGLARYLPSVYQARAKILVESQQIPTGLAQSTVTANAAERLQVIEQRLMTRDQLLEIARKYQLYAKASQPLSPSDVVELMRDAARIRQTDVGSQRGQRGQNTIAFTVSFEYEDATIASRVANEFVTLILQQNIQSRTSRASETSRFFQQQVDRLQQDLIAQESRIVDFKNKNNDSLPTNIGSRQVLLSQLQTQSAEVSGKIAGLEGDSPVDSNEGELKRLRMQLLQMRAIYNDSHPEVRKLVAQIDALQTAQTLQPGAQAQQDAVQPESLRTQLAALQAQKDDLTQRMKAVSDTIAKGPEVEIALAALMRDYSGLQTDYRDEKAKLADAATGELLEQDRQAERFEVIEQATVPSEPARPDRQRIVRLGSIGAIAIGIAMVALVETIDQSIRGSADLEKRLRLRPIASIPYVTTGADRKRRRQLLLVLLVAAAGLLTAALIYIQISYLPIDLVAQKLWQRLGL